MIPLINKLSNIKQYYEEYKKESDEFLKMLKESNLNIVYKWEYYKDFCKMNSDYNIHSWNYRLEEFEKNNIEIYEYFVNSRHETVYFTEMVDRIEESLEDDYEFDEEDNWRKIDLNKLKKEIIDSGYTGFVYDW